MEPINWEMPAKEVRLFPYPKKISSLSVISLSHRSFSFFSSSSVPPERIIGIITG